MLSGSTQTLLPTDYPSHILCQLSILCLFSVIYFVLFLPKVTEHNNQKNNVPPISLRHFSGYLSLYTFPKIFP